MHFLFCLPKKNLLLNAYISESLLCIFQSPFIDKQVLCDLYSRTEQHAFRLGTNTSHTLVILKNVKHSITSSHSITH